MRKPAAVAAAAFLFCFTAPALGRTRVVPVIVPDQKAVQASVEAGSPAVPITDTFAGSARVASYTVAHGRDGAPEWGLVIGDLADGSRAYGKVEDASLLVELESREFVGETVELVPADGGVNLVKV